MNWCHTSAIWVRRQDAHFQYFNTSHTPLTFWGKALATILVANVQQKHAAQESPNVACQQLTEVPQHDLISVSFFHTARLLAVAARLMEF